MSIVIEGRDGSKIVVDEGGRMLVSAETIGAALQAAIDKALNFTALFVDASATAGDIVAYLRNTDNDHFLVVDRIYADSVNAATWILQTVTGTAGGGNGVTPANQRVGSGVVAEASALADNVTGLTLENELYRFATAASGDNEIFPSGLVLETGHDIALEYDAGTTGAANAMIDFHYRPKC